MTQFAHDRFYDNMLKGNAYKDLIKLMLQKSGYAVYPYGYESNFSDVKSKLTQESRNSKTVRRIRSSPDLLVYDDQKNDLMLVEVKMRGNSPPNIKPQLIENIKDFWSDSILVVVVPDGNVFYAQKNRRIRNQTSILSLIRFREISRYFYESSVGGYFTLQRDCLAKHEDKKRRHVRKKFPITLEFLFSVTPPENVFG